MRLTTNNNNLKKAFLFTFWCSILTIEHAYTNLKRYICYRNYRRLFS